MTRYEILSFLESDDATAEQIAENFSMPRSYVYSRLTVLNRQGLITKKKNSDGVLHFALTKWGKDKIAWIEEHDEEDLEGNNSSGGNKMGRQTVSSEEELWICPECETEYELSFPVDKDDLYCEKCDELLEPVSDDEEMEEQEETPSRRR